MTRDAVAQLGVLVGCLVVAVGAFLAWPPLGLVAGGAGLVWFFLMVFDVDGDD